MNIYKNLGGNSIISAYDDGGDYIKIRFSTGVTNLYNYQSAGMQNIKKMKELAVTGKGLNSYIEKNLKKDYVV